LGSPHLWSAAALARQNLWTNWGRPLRHRWARSHPACDHEIAPLATTDSTEALRAWAPPPWCLWKRADRISTGWRRRPVRNPLSGHSRNMEAVLYD